MQLEVEPASGLHIIEPRYYNMEAFEEGGGEFLYLADMRLHLYLGTSFHHKLSSDCRLGLPYVSLSK